MPDHPPYDPAFAPSAPPRPRPALWTFETDEDAAAFVAAALRLRHVSPGADLEVWVRRPGPDPHLFAVMHRLTDGWMWRGPDGGPLPLLGVDGRMIPPDEPEPARLTFTDAASADRWLSRDLDAHPPEDLDVWVERPEPRLYAEVRPKKHDPERLRVHDPERLWARYTPPAPPARLSVDEAWRRAAADLGERFRVAGERWRRDQEASAPAERHPRRPVSRWTFADSPSAEDLERQWSAGLRSREDQKALYEQWHVEPVGPPVTSSAPVVFTKGLATDHFGAPSSPRPTVVFNNEPDALRWMASEARRPARLLAGTRVKAEGRLVGRWTGRRWVDGRTTVSTTGARWFGL